MSRTERFNKTYIHLLSLGLVHKKKDIADAMKASASNVTSALKGNETILTDNFLLRFNSAFENIFNLQWLLNGTGEMLAPQQTQGNNIIQGNGISHVQQVNGYSTAITYPVSTSNSGNQDSDSEFERAPIIPQNWAKKPNFDIYEAVQENLDKVELSDVVVADLPISVWHRITSNCMYPYCFAGDKVALTEIPDKKAIIPGDIYGIDTRSNGMIIRILFPVEGGFRAHAYNSTEYPDFLIPHADVIRVSARSDYLGYNILQINPNNKKI